MPRSRGSIITNDTEHCYLTGQCGPLEKHHIFGGNPNRKHSEFYGLWVMLTHDAHNEPPNGVHFNKNLMQKLHEVGQQAFENAHGDREDFIRIFGRNYIMEDKK